AGAGGAGGLPLLREGTTLALGRGAGGRVRAVRAHPRHHPRLPARHRLVGVARAAATSAGGAGGDAGGGGAGGGAVGGAQLGRPSPPRLHPQRDGAGVLAGQQPARLLGIGGRSRGPAAARTPPRGAAPAALHAGRAGAAGPFPTGSARLRAGAATRLPSALGGEARILLVAEPTGGPALPGGLVSPLPGLLPGDDGPGDRGGDPRAAARDLAGAGVLPGHRPGPERLLCRGAPPPHHRTAAVAAGRPGAGPVASVVAVGEEGVVVGELGEAIEGDGAEEVDAGGDHHQGLEQPGEPAVARGDEQDEEDHVVEAEAVAELVEARVL